jgi:hypothetical protein
MSFLTVSAAWPKGKGVQAEKMPQSPLQLFICDLKDPLNKREFHFKNIENEVFLNIKNA